MAKFPKSSKTAFAYAKAVLLGIVSPNPISKYEKEIFAYAKMLNMG